jgi:FlaA1/EpsC-like NDP-sugar epimerase
MAEGRRKKAKPAELPFRRRVLIAGAGEAGVMIASEIQVHATSRYELVGFVDDDQQKQGRMINKCRVLGTCEEIPVVVSQYDIDEILIVIPSAPGNVIRRISHRALDAQVSFRILPGLLEIIRGDASIRQIREIEPEDLLKREPVELDTASISYCISGRTILITGAGGSIGSELAKMVASFYPKRIILLGHGENSIFNIEREMREEFPSIELHPVIGDIQDEKKMRQVFLEEQPELIFHAAAHKHIQLMEQNAEEAVKNNVIGTRNLVDLADEFGVRRFIYISTDKAVNPISVMGASKRVAELITLMKNQKSETEFIIVRFGNVLGSRGSAVTLFKKQISDGGPITITHPEMTRYFMTIYEAVQLVVQAAAIGNPGDVLILEMGAPIRIEDLARDLIRLAGFIPDKDITIDYIGMKEGEKLSEELWDEDEVLEDLLGENEQSTRTSLKYIRRARGIKPDPTKLLPLIEELVEAARDMEHDHVLKLMGEILPTFSKRLTCPLA